MTLTDEELDDDLSSAGSPIGLPSIQGKGKGIGKRTGLPSADSSVASDPSVSKTDFSEAVMQVRFSWN